MTPKLRAQILKHVVNGDTVTDDDCWQWTGALSHGTPSMRYEGVVGAVRRHILRDAGKPLGRSVATVWCVTPNCVSPACVTRASASAVNHRTARERGHQSSPTTRRKLALAARARWKKFTPELVQRIRSDGRPGSVWAKELGVSEAAISAVRTRRTWKDYSNPFAGLGAL